MIKIQRSLDKYIGSFLCGILSPFVIENHNIILQNKKIIFVKLQSLGESILTLTLLKTLHEKYNCTIDIITTPVIKAVFENQPFINNIKLVTISETIKPNQYDIAIDGEPYLKCSSLLAWWLAKESIGFSHGIRAKLYDKRIRYNDKQHLVQTYLDLVNEKEHTGHLIPLKYPDSAETRIQNFFMQNKIVDKTLIGIHPGVSESGRSRIWPLHNWVGLIRKASKEKKPWMFILTGTSNEKPMIEAIIKNLTAAEQKYAISTAGMFSLNELFCLLKHLNVFIASDTGPMHMAAAIGTRTIGLFGPNTPVRRAPYGPKNISIYHPLLKEPCINVHKDEISDCDHPHMEMIGYLEVYQKVKTLTL